MRVEIIAEFKHGRDTYYPGEIINFPDCQTGEYFCRAGWAKDVEGIFPTGNPSLEDTVLLVESVEQAQKTPEITGE